MTSTLSTISVSAFKTTSTESKFNPRSMDTSGYYSTPPQASDSIITALDHITSRTSEFQATQSPAEEYVFVSEFASNQQFGNPDTIIDERTGNIYVADYFNNRVIKFDSSGNVITQWGSQGSNDGQFINPQDVGIDSAG